MKRLIKGLFISLTAIITIGLITLWILNVQELSKRKKASCAGFLRDSQKNYIEETVNLKKELDTRVWPGMDSVNIPVIVYNSCYEFMLCSDTADSSWEKTEKDKFMDTFYWRRKLTEPKSFAVLVNGKWAGKMGELNQMNYEFLNGIRNEFPPVLAQLFPYFLAEIKPDQYVVSLLHEMFHAFQAINDSSRFEEIQSLYRLEKKYPYNNYEFAKLWNEEGAALYEAINETEKSKAKKRIRKFLEIRNQRRAMVHFTEDLINFERELEWLEGLAKYAEIRFYELAAAETSETAEIKYQKGLPYWQMEFDRLREELGEQSGDFRFYLSGMAQAKALDILYPDWKNEVLSEHLFLEDLLEKYSSD